MDKKIGKLILLLILLVSCKVNTDRHESKIYPNDSVVNDNFIPIDKDTVDYFKRANEFGIKVLGDKLRTHEFGKIQEAPRHLEIFSTVRLLKIIAFSNKDYPKLIKPDYYEHFTLFCIEYESTHYAELSFQELTRLTKFDLDKIDNLDSLTVEKVKFMTGESKPGGFIFQKGNWIFSLVETCGDTPIGGTWTDYEDLFVSFIVENDEDSITVLNADCGKMKYIEKQIKPVHNSVYKPLLAVGLRW
jgi:hypothetical protein